MTQISNLMTFGDGTFFGAWIFWTALAFRDKNSPIKYIFLSFLQKKSH